jgi:hypothetical protein
VETVRNALYVQHDILKVSYREMEDELGKKEYISYCNLMRGMG